MNAPKEYKEHNIQTLICTAEELPYPENIGIPFIRFPVPNGHPVPAKVQELFIDMVKPLFSKEIPLLIYCQGGQNRSAGLALLWLVKIAGKSHEEAWKTIKAVREDSLTWSKDFNDIKELK